MSKSEAEIKSLAARVLKGSHKPSEEDLKVLAQADPEAEPRVPNTPQEHESVAAVKGQEPRV